MLFWAARHPVYAIALKPLAVFAMLNFVIGSRAIFYSAPAVWFGLAFIIITAGRAIYQMVLTRMSGRQGLPAVGNLDASQAVPVRGDLPSTMSAPFSAIINTPAFKFADSIVGIMDASMTRKFCIPCTVNVSSTTAYGSVFGAIRQVPIR
jgi:hypothetical protein